VDYTFTAQDAGQNSLTFALRTAGLQSVSRVVGLRGSSAASAQVFASVPGAPRLTFLRLPDTVPRYGAVVHPEMTDAYGKRCNGALGRVQFTATIGVRCCRRRTTSPQWTQSHLHRPRSTRPAAGR